MKKIYALAVLLLIASITFGQTFGIKSSTSHKVSFNYSDSKTATDTTGFSSNFLPEFAVGGQVIGYTNAGGGYVYGVNSINGTSINKISQGYSYLSAGSIGIEGVAFWLIGKEGVSGDPTSKITFSIYNKPDSIPTTQVGTVKADYLFNDCDTNFLALNVATFPSVIPVTADFAIVCDFANIKTDTLGFFCDQDGEGIGWNALRYGTTWYTYKAGYGLNTNISIFAIVDINYVGIESNDFFQGAKMTINQNPSKDVLSVSYAVENDANVVFELLSTTGQVIYTSNEGAKVKGNVYTISSDISNLADGTYLCSLNTNGQRLIKKLVVSK